jgi:hypothetical protein
MLGYDGQAPWKRFVTEVPLPFLVYVYDSTLVIEIDKFPRRGILVEGRRSTVFHQLGGSRPSDPQCLNSWPLSLERTDLSEPQLCLHPIILAHAWTGGQIAMGDIKQLIGRSRRPRSEIDGVLTGNSALTRQLGAHEGLRVRVSTIFDAEVRPYQGRRR